MPEPFTRVDQFIEDLPYFFMNMASEEERQKLGFKYRLERMQQSARENPALFARFVNYLQALATCHRAFMTTYSDWEAEDRIRKGKLK